MLLKSDMIRAHRHQKGWTQEQLAELCDISVRTVERLEKTGMASMETTNALASVLEVERVQLLADEGAPPAHTELQQQHVAILATVTFVLGLAVGVLF